MVVVNIFYVFRSSTKITLRSRHSFDDHLKTLAGFTMKVLSISKQEIVLKQLNVVKML